MSAKAAKKRAPPAKCRVCSGAHDWTTCPKAREEFAKGATLTGKKRGRHDDSDDDGSSSDGSSSSKSTSSSASASSSSSRASAASAAGAAAGSGGDDSDAVSKCELCSHATDSSCSDDCAIGEATRNKRIKTRRKKRCVAAPAAGAAARKTKTKKDVVIPKAEREKALKAGKRPGSGDRLDERRLKALAQQDLALVPLKCVAPHRELWRPWIWGKPVAQRKAAFEKWQSVVQKMYHLEGADALGQCTAADQKRAKTCFDGIAIALDPEPDLGTTALIHRLESMVEIFALQLMTFNTAREDGWRVARLALEHHEGEGQHPKAWQTAVAMARKKGTDDSPNPTSPAGKGGGKSPRRRRQRGGGGAQTQGKGKGGRGGKKSG